jgi:hypothetical protein
MRKTVVALMFLLLAHPALPAEPESWIKFSAVQMMEGNVSTSYGQVSGKIVYVDVMIGSNEQPSDASTRRVEAHLKVVESGTRCAASTLLKTKLSPPVSLLRFSIGYPNQSDQIIPAGPPVQYKVFATLREGGEEQSASKIFSFPGGGGTPACKKLK